MHFMLQQEVVDRMVAGAVDAGVRPAVGDAAGALRDGAAVRRAARRLPSAAEGGFGRRAPGAARRCAARCDGAALARVVTAAFTKRRKTLRNALAGAVRDDALATLGIDPQLRPENLAVDDYVALSRYVPD